MLSKLRTRLTHAAFPTLVVSLLVGPFAYASDTADLWIAVVGTLVLLSITGVRNSAKAIGVGLSIAIFNLMMISNVALTGADANRVAIAAVFAVSMAWIHMAAFRVVRSGWHRLLFALMVGQLYAGIAIMHFELAFLQSDAATVAAHMAIMLIWAAAVLLIRRYGFTYVNALSVVCLVTSGVVVSTLIGNGTSALLAEAYWFIIATGISASLFATTVAALLLLERHLHVLVEVSEYLRILVGPIAWFAVGYLLIVVLFATWYWAIDAAACRSVENCIHPFAGPGISPNTSFGGFVYFSLITVATVGFGDVIPTSPIARFACGLQIVIGVAWMTVVFAAVIAYVQPRFEELTKRRHLE